MQRGAVGGVRVAAREALHHRDGLALSAVLPLPLVAGLLQAPLQRGAHVRALLRLLRLLHALSDRLAVPV